MNVLIITRTNWEEPPRMRHQLSRLLRDMGGNRVFYVDICSSVRDFGLNKWNNEGIGFYGFSELIHHQLRPFKFIREIHKSIVKKKLSVIAGRHEFDLVINFNYDLCFLKEIFSGSQVITMLNDNFYLQAWPWMKRAIAKQVARTAAVSDAVMTVSHPLVDLLTPFN